MTANSELWPRIGTVVGQAGTGQYRFILQQLGAKVGDIVATHVEVPLDRTGDPVQVVVWGRIVSINRFNPFFPAEAAQELANENINFLDTVLSQSRDHLDADVLVLGVTSSASRSDVQLSPLTYPVRPSAEVLYPSADAVRSLLTGEDAATADRYPKLRVGSLIARRDVEVCLSANDVVSRHLAILAMTGGGKTVAARRILRELAQFRYPLIIFDPHGDYLGLYERQSDLGADVKVKIYYPVIRMRESNQHIVTDLIEKMGKSLSDAQQQFYLWLMNNCQVTPGTTAEAYIKKLITLARSVMGSRRRGEGGQEELSDTRPSTMNAVVRSLEFVADSLSRMEKNNEKLRTHKRFANYRFEDLPDAWDTPEELINPGVVSILYLAGYDHLTQSALVSIVLEALFYHRSSLRDRIPPFQAVIEEAHNFIPSRQEGTAATPSLETIRKVITEGRKFGTGLILISQRPSRLDETTLSQCNSFLVLRLVNPKDKSFVRSVMENLSEADAGLLQAFGRGQGIVSGQAVRFPLIVQIDFDRDLVSSAMGDENFISVVAAWSANGDREINESIVGEGMQREARSQHEASASDRKQGSSRRRTGRRGGLLPDY